MSILIIEALYEGLIFGADRSITTTYGNGTSNQEKQQPKVLKWPKDNILLGFVGAADVGGMPMHEWLATLTEEFSAMASLKEIAQELTKKVQSQRRKDEGDDPPEPLIIHIGGFEKKNDFWVPHIWYISNAHRLGLFGYLDITKEFSCSEEFWKYFKDKEDREIDPSEIREALKVRAKQFNPFWFHQGIDLITFNALEASVRSAFKHLCQNHPDHDIPGSIEDWAKHVRMQVLMYGVYFEAFHPEGERYVGGGVDIEFLHWPR